jgi:hypothetical protein
MEWLCDKRVPKKVTALDLTFIYFAVNKSKGSSEFERLTRTLRENGLSHIGSLKEKEGIVQVRRLTSEQSPQGTSC